MVAELSSVEVVTLGLVKLGANQKPFFIVKNLDGGEIEMADKIVKEEIVQEEVVQEETMETPETVSLLEKIKKLLATKEPVVEVEEPVVEPDLAGQIETLQKAQEDLRQELVKARKIAEDERETRIWREYLEKADGFSAVGASKEQIAKVLQACDGMGEEVTKTISDILKTADEAMRQSGVYEEVGTAEVEESGFIAKAEKVAGKLMEENVKLSKAEALAQAYKSVAAQDPDLAAEYVNERRNAVKEV